MGLELRNPVFPDCFGDMNCGDSRRSGSLWSNSSLGRRENYRVGTYGFCD